MNSQHKHETIAQTDEAVQKYHNGETWRSVDLNGPYVVNSARSVAGNMSPAYNQYGEDLTPEQKKQRANENVKAFLEAAGLRPENAFIMLPQQEYPTELGIVDVDSVFAPGEISEPTVAKTRADLLVTHNEETVLACRPADCPVVTIEGEDKDGQKVLALLHVGWQGLNAGYFEQAFDYLENVQGIQKESVRMQMSGAGYGENFPMYNAKNPQDGSLQMSGSERMTHPDNEHLFIDPKLNEATGKYDFRVDMPGFIRRKVKELGYSANQLYEEGTDTADPQSGMSSHKRDNIKDNWVEVINEDGDLHKYNPYNTRDMVVATMGRPDTALIARAYTRASGRAAVSGGITLTPRS